jgi:hypothetical protein
MNVLLINKILLGIEIVPTIFLLFLALLLLVDSRPVFLLTLLLSILSLMSLIYIVMKTILGDTLNIDGRFIYLSHIGFVITILGVLILLIHGNGFKSHSPNAPFSAFSCGLVACIPYFHVMIVNNFFLQR